VAQVALQIEAGRIDRAALEPKLTEFATAWGTTRSGDAAAVERLHAILDADQRADLVEALRNSREEGRRGKGERLLMLADELSLTSDQMLKIREVLVQRRAERKRDKNKDGAGRGKRRFEGMLDAFETEEFSLDQVPAADELRDKAMRRAERMLGTIEAVLPILTAEQRKLAAAKLEKFSRDAMP